MSFYTELYLLMSIFHSVENSQGKCTHFYSEVRTSYDNLHFIFVFFFSLLYDHLYLHKLREYSFFLLTINHINKQSQIFVVTVKTLKTSNRLFFFDNK